MGMASTKKITTQNDQPQKIVLQRMSQRFSLGGAALAGLQNKLAGPNQMSGRLSVASHRGEEIE